MDANLAGGYSKHFETNLQDCLSRTRYIVKYQGCPIICSLKLQSTISLSTTEAKYVALSTAMPKVILLLSLAEETQKYSIKLIKKQPVIKYKVYKDNVGAIELANTIKLRPRTKHMVIQYHPFRT